MSYRNNRNNNYPDGNKEFLKGAYDNINFSKNSSAEEIAEKYLRNKLLQSIKSSNEREETKISQHRNLDTSFCGNYEKSLISAHDGTKSPHLLQKEKGEYNFNNFDCKGPLRKENAVNETSVFSNSFPNENLNESSYGRSKLLGNLNRDDGNKKIQNEYCDSNHLSKKRNEVADIKPSSNFMKMEFSSNEKNTSLYNEESSIRERKPGVSPLGELLDKYNNSTKEDVFEKSKIYDYNQNMFYNTKEKEMATTNTKKDFPLDEYYFNLKPDKEITQERNNANTHNKFSLVGSHMEEWRLQNNENPMNKNSKAEYLSSANNNNNINSINRSHNPGEKKENDTNRSMLENKYGARTDRDFFVGNDYFLHNEDKLKCPLKSETHVRKHIQKRKSSNSNCSINNNLNNNSTTIRPDYVQAKLKELQQKETSERNKTNDMREMREIRETTERRERKEMKENSGGIEVNNITTSYATCDRPHIKEKEDRSRCNDEIAMISKINIFNNRKNSCNTDRMFTNYSSYKGEMNGTDENDVLYSTSNFYIKNSTDGKENNDERISSISFQYIKNITDATNLIEESVPDDNLHKLNFSDGSKIMESPMNINATNANISLAPEGLLYIPEKVPNKNNTVSIAVNSNNTSASICGKSNVRNQLNSEFMARNDFIPPGCNKPYKDFQDTGYRNEDKQNKTNIAMYGNTPRGMSSEREQFRCCEPKVGNSSVMHTSSEEQKDNSLRAIASTTVHRNREPPPQYVSSEKKEGLIIDDIHFTNFFNSNNAANYTNSTNYRTPLNYSDKCTPSSNIMGDSNYTVISFSDKSVAMHKPSSCNNNSTTINNNNNNGNMATEGNRRTQSSHVSRKELNTNSHGKMGDVKVVYRENDNGISDVIEYGSTTDYRHDNVNKNTYENTYGNIYNNAHDDNTSKKDSVNRERYIRGDIPTRELKIVEREIKNNNNNNIDSLIRGDGNYNISRERDIREYIPCADRKVLAQFNSDTPMENGNIRNSTNKSNIHGKDLYNTNISREENYDREYNNYNYKNRNNTSNSSMYQTNSRRENIDQGSGKSYDPRNHSVTLHNLNYHSSEKAKGSNIEKKMEKEFWIREKEAIIGGQLNSLNVTTIREESKEDKRNAKEILQKEENASNYMLKNINTYEELCKYINENIDLLPATTKNLNILLALALYFLNFNIKNDPTTEAYKMELVNDDILIKLINKILYCLNLKTCLLKENKANTNENKYFYIQIKKNEDELKKVEKRKGNAKEMEEESKQKKYVVTSTTATSTTTTTTTDTATTTTTAATTITTDTKTNEKNSESEACRNSFFTFYNKRIIYKKDDKSSLALLERNKIPTYNSAEKSQKKYFYFNEDMKIISVLDIYKITWCLCVLKKNVLHMDLILILYKEIESRYIEREFYYCLTYLFKYSNLMELEKCKANLNKNKDTFLKTCVQNKYTENLCIYLLLVHICSIGNEMFYKEHEKNVHYIINYFYEELENLNVYVVTNILWLLSTLKIKKKQHPSLYTKVLNVLKNDFSVLNKSVLLVHIIWSLCISDVLCWNFFIDISQCIINILHCIPLCEFITIACCYSCQKMLLIKKWHEMRQVEGERTKNKYKDVSTTLSNNTLFTDFEKECSRYDSAIINKYEKAEKLFPNYFYKKPICQSIVFKILANTFLVPGKTEKPDIYGTEENSAAVDIDTAETKKKKEELAWKRLDTCDFMDTYNNKTYIYNDHDGSIRRRNRSLSIDKRYRNVNEELEQEQEQVQEHYQPQQQQYERSGMYGRRNDGDNIGLYGKGNCSLSTRKNHRFNSSTIYNNEKMNTSLSSSRTDKFSMLSSGRCKKKLKEYYSVEDSNNMKWDFVLNSSVKVLLTHLIEDCCNNFDSINSFSLVELLYTLCVLNLDEEKKKIVKCVASRIDICLFNENYEKFIKKQKKEVKNSTTDEDMQNEKNDMLILSYICKKYVEEREKKGKCKTADIDTKFILLVDNICFMKYVHNDGFLKMVKLEKGGLSQSAFDKIKNILNVTSGRDKEMDKEMEKEVEKEKEKENDRNKDRDRGKYTMSELAEVEKSFRNEPISDSCFKENFFPDEFNSSSYNNAQDNKRHDKNINHSNYMYHSNFPMSTRGRNTNKEEGEEEKECTQSTETKRSTQNQYTKLSANGELKKESGMQHVGQYTDDYGQLKNSHYVNLSNVSNISTSKHIPNEKNLFCNHSDKNNNNNYNNNNNNRNAFGNQKMIANESLQCSRNTRKAYEDKETDLQDSYKAAHMYYRDNCSEEKKHNQKLIDDYEKQREQIKGNDNEKQHITERDLTNEDINSNVNEKTSYASNEWKKENTEENSKMEDMYHTEIYKHIIAKRNVKKILDEHEKDQILKRKQWKESLKEKEREKEEAENVLRKSNENRITFYKLFMMSLYFSLSLLFLFLVIFIYTSLK